MTDSDDNLCGRDLDRIDPEVYASDDVSYTVTTQPAGLKTWFHTRWRTPSRGSGSCCRLRQFLGDLYGDRRKVVAEREP